MEQFSMDGLWWDPESPDQRLAGTLTFTPEEGLGLSLLGGAFSGWDAFGVLNHHRLLYGAGPSLVTLVDVMDLGAQGTIPHYLSQRLRPHFALVGAHVEVESRFDRLSVAFTHLPEWIPFSGWSMTLNMHQQVFGYTYTVPPDQDRAGTLIGDVAPALSFRTGAMQSRRPEPVERVSIRVWGKDRLFSLREGLEDVVTPLQDLITLATGSPNAVEELLLFLPSETRALNLLYQPAVDPPKPRKPLQWDEFLVPFDRFDALGDPPIWTRWFEVHKKLRKALRLFFAVVQTPNQFVDLKFVSLVTACEALHRDTRPQNEIDPVDHEARLASILKSAPQAHHKWLQRRLKYSNEVSLESRLASLAKSLGNLKRTVLPHAAVRLAVNTRNYFAHRTRDLEAKAASGEELLKLNLRLQCLLEANIISEIGFSRRDAVDLVANGRTLKRLQFLTEG